MSIVMLTIFQIVDHNPAASAFANGVASAPQPVSNSIFQQQPQQRQQNAVGLSGPYALQLWYFGRLTRDQADTELSVRGAEGDFLVRDSESNVRNYTVPVGEGRIRWHLSLGTIRYR